VNVSRRRHILPRTPRRGYALLLVLLVLAVAAAATAGVCRISLRKALHARRAEEDLQRRWAVVSCRAALLPRADSVLARAEREGAAPAAEVRRDVRLGGETLTLVFGDEQAKANVNLLYRAAGAGGTERAVRRLIATANVDVELRPLPARPGATSDDDPLPPFESFGQVFARATPRELIGPAGGRSPVPAAVLTCWGDGTLNFRRASAEAVREVAAPHAGAALANRLVQLRDKHPGLDAAAVLDQVKLSDTAREALEEVLVDESACFSLWIITRSADRTGYDLAVLDESSGEPGRPVVFSW
jgi:hypothetical protein